MSEGSVLVTPPAVPKDQQLCDNIQRMVKFVRLASVTRVEPQRSINVEARQQRRDVLADMDRLMKELLTGTGKGARYVAFLCTASPRDPV